MDSSIRADPYYGGNRLCQEPEVIESALIDVPSVRTHFPSLAKTHNGEPVLFFDNPAGTQVPQEAIDGYVRYLREHNANTGGSFSTSRATDRIIGEARTAMADFLGATSPDEIVFGQNMTSLTFAFSRAFARLLQPGDEIVLTRL